MEEFKREDRYVVMKFKDVDNALSIDERLVLSNLLLKIDRYRKNNEKAPLECVVVENDWPEYETVWKMIEERCSGNNNKT